MVWAIPHLVPKLYFAIIYMNCITCYSNWFPPNIICSTMIFHASNDSGLRGSDYPIWWNIVAGCMVYELLWDRSNQSQSRSSHIATIIYCCISLYRIISGIRLMLQLFVYLYLFPLSQWVDNFLTVTQLSAPLLCAHTYIYVINCNKTYPWHK